MLGSKRAAGIIMLFGVLTQVFVLEMNFSFQNKEWVVVILGYIFIAGMSYMFGRQEAEKEIARMYHHMLMMSSLMALVSEVLYRNDRLKDTFSEVDDIVKQYGGLDHKNASQIVEEQVQEKKHTMDENVNES